MWVFYPGRIGIWRCWFFVEKGKPEKQPGEKPSETAVWEPTTNSTHIRHWARIEPRPHWWEASDLTTVPVACLAKIGAGDPWSSGTFLFLFLILWQIENNKLGYDLYQISERDCKIFYWPRKYDVIPQKNGLLQHSWRAVFRSNEKNHIVFWALCLAAQTGYTTVFAKVA